jgi:cysteine desulfurase
MTLSAHKIGGPQGVGALICREGIPLEALIKGGGQERGMRAGTENVAGIAGFGAAADAARTKLAVESSHMVQLRERLEIGLKSITPEVTIFGEAVERLPNTCLFSISGMKAETAVIGFDLEGVAVSSGAACSSGKVTPSHVLAAMGVPLASAQGAIRASLGYASTDKNVRSFLNAWEKITKGLYRTQIEPKSLSMAEVSAEADRKP